MWRLANKNLALNSIIGAAFGGNLFPEFYSELDSFRVQLLDNGAWPSQWVSYPANSYSTGFSLIPSRLALLVGEAQNWLPELIERASKLSVNGGFESGADL